MRKRQHNGKIMTSAKMDEREYNILQRHIESRTNQYTTEEVKWAYLINLKRMQ